MTATETEPTAAVPRELHRSRDRRLLAGVAGGLGRYFDVDPAFFRLAFVLLTFVGGAGILLYIVAALVIPDDGRSDSIASQALRRNRDRPWLLVGVALVAIAVVSLVAQGDVWPDSGVAWLLLLLGALAVVIAQRAGDTRAPVAAGPGASAGAAEPPRPSLFLPGVGLLLAAAGVLALLEGAGVDIPWDVALAIGAIATGVGVAAGWSLGRRTGGLAIVGVLLAALAIAVATVDITVDGPVGERRFAPLVADELQPRYRVAVGDLQVDLSDTALAPGATTVEADVGIGELTVVVPDDVNVEITASASAGEVTLLGSTEGGFDVERMRTLDRAGSDRTLVIDAHVGFGEVVVEREGS